MLLSKKSNCKTMQVTSGDGGGGGFTRPIPRDGGADQFRGIPIIGRLPTDGTKGPEEKGYGQNGPTQRV